MQKQHKRRRRCNPGNLLNDISDVQRVQPQTAVFGGDFHAEQAMLGKQADIALRKLAFIQAGFIGVNRQLLGEKLLRVSNLDPCIQLARVLIPGKNHE